MKLWHLEEKTGADIVVTCPPVFIEQLYDYPDQEKLVFEKDRILEDIPGDVLDKLMRIPYFERAYAEDGYSRDEYNSHPALIRTAEQFSKATVEMVEFAGKCLENACFS
jgi:transaldolase